MKKQSYKKNSYIKKSAMIICALICCLGIGYAAVTSSVNILGSTTSLNYGNLFIETVETVDSNGVTEALLPIYEDPTLTTSLAFSTNNYSFITYSVTIANGGETIKKYTGETFNVDTTIKNVIDYELTGGLVEGQYLLPGQSTTFELTYQYKGTAVAGDYNLEMIFNFDDLGNFYAYSNTANANLTGNNTYAAISIQVANNNNNSIHYSLNLTNDKFRLTDINGNALGTLTAAGKSDNEVIVYLRQIDNAIYYGTSYTTGINLTYNSETIYFTDINITTDITPGYQDDTIPQIGTVTLVPTTTIGTFDVNWSRTDTGGSPIVNYFVRLYDSSNQMIVETTVPGDITTYRYSGRDAGTYYAIVYGIDEAENSGEAYCSSATTSTTDCRKSANTNITWTKNVTYSLTNLTHNGPATVNLGATLSFTITAASNYTLPNSITVVMNGTTLTSGTGYTYTSSSGAVSIPNVSGDITITASGTSSTCLVKGTKVRLADGTIKKIEDVKYDDLLLVWNYENGQFDYVYPIWIEKTKVSSYYQITTFSDGTTLKTVGYHGVFNPDINLFVTVDKQDQFKVGTSVLKVDKNNKLYSVKVTKIEIIKQPVNFYQVISTKYFNIVSDDVLTTDGTLMFSNLYGFKENLVWPDQKKQILNNPNNLYKYEELKDVFPRYMFEGMRAAEAKYLANNNYFTKEYFIEYAKGNLLHEAMLLNPITNNQGKRMWMVTTSDDKYTFDKQQFLRDEGSIYTLKQPLTKSNKTFVGWYEATTNQYYKPGDKIQMWYGMHFKAIWK